MKTIDWQKLARDAKFNIKHFIDGRYVEASQVELIEKYSPRDGSLLYSLPAGTEKEIDQAIINAKQAFNDKRWRGLPLSQRKIALTNLANLIEANQETFALYECLDAGKPITQALAEVSQAATMLRDVANDVDKLFSVHTSDTNYSAYQIRKPIGVVGAIIPWNYPLVIAVLKIGPALIMGNCLVLKPSEYTCLSAGYLAALALEAGIPPGVLNVVHGAGQTVGAALAHHRDVDLLSFTGSSSTGQAIQVAAGQSNMKRLLLECGGKSPYIIFDDCPSDLDMLAKDIVFTAFQNQSQNCMAASRLLLHENIKRKLLPKILEQAALFIPQDPLCPKTTFGAMIHESHMERVLSYIKDGKKEGATILAGGHRVIVDTGSTYRKGYYVQPTIFDNVKPQDKLALDEIFGPVLSVFTFTREEEAIEQANNTRYGLSAYVATENMGRAQRLSQEIKAGAIMFLSTSTPSDCFQELGKEGCRESGFGYEGGLMGLASYSHTATVHQWT